MRILFLFIVFNIALLSTAQATVFEFNDDGSVTKYEAIDYLAPARHKEKRLPIKVLTTSHPSHLTNKKYDDLIQSAARKSGINANLIHAVISIESSYKPCAMSPKGAEGLMQLMPSTANKYGIKDSCDPEDNINGGVEYLSDLLKRYNGNGRLALAAYNAGENAVDKYEGIPPYDETIQYIEKIESILGQNLNEYLAINTPASIH